MNIFDSAPEFVDFDNRRKRPMIPVSADSLRNKLEVHLPENLIQGKHVLDLGSCIGAAGHWALSHGAAHYTGVEFQDYYVQSSQEALSKYWSTDRFTIIQQDINTFLTETIAAGKTYDYVLACGIIYGFFDIFDILRKITAVTKDALVIESINLRTGATPKFGGILLRVRPMIKAGRDTEVHYTGMSANINQSGLDMVMAYNSFKRTEPRLIPQRGEHLPDPFNDEIVLEDGSRGVHRYIHRYFRQQQSSFMTLEDKFLKDIPSGDNLAGVGSKSDQYTFDKMADIMSKPKDTWQFDSEVAYRFQVEAVKHIPDYDRVIEKCVGLAKQRYAKDSAIIDVGSALSYTIGKFISQGYTNIQGVESSRAMIDNPKNQHADRVIHSETFPSGTYKLVTMNWTLHFIKDKLPYLQAIAAGLDSDGTLILTDKTVQSAEVKEMYYQFKLENKVDPGYIKEKERQLVGVMHLETLDWYLNNLRELFGSVEIINSAHGFTTFMCRK